MTVAAPSRPEKRIVKPRIDRIPALDRLVRTVNVLHTRNADVSIQDQGTGVLYDRRAVLPTNPWKFRCEMSADQSLASGAAHAVVNYDTVNFDTIGDAGVTSGFSTTNHNYLVPVSGYYFLAVQVLWNPAGVMTWFIGNANVYVNGVKQPGANVIAGTSGGNVITGTLYPINIADSFFLNVGDVITVQATQQNSAALAESIKSGGTNSYWAMHLISA
jgi:hypothetical protein